MPINSRYGYLLALILLLAPFSMAQASKLYKWVDDDGQVHYSQTPPAHGRATELQLPRTAPPSQPATQPHTNETDVLSQTRELRRHNCEVAQENLRIYQTSLRIRQADGQIIDLDTVTRQARIAEAEAMIEEFCD